MEGIVLFAKAISSAVVLSMMSVSSYFYDSPKVEQIVQEAVAPEANIMQVESYNEDVIQNDSQNNKGSTGDGEDSVDEKEKMQEDKHKQEELAKKLDEEKKIQIETCKKVKQSCEEKIDDIKDSIQDTEKDIALDDQEIKSYEETIAKYTPGCNSWNNRFASKSPYIGKGPCIYVTQSTEGKNKKEDQKKNREDRLDDYKKQLSKLTKGECEDYKKSCK